MAGNFHAFAEVEEQLRAEIEAFMNSPARTMTKTARRKLQKTELARKKFVHRPLLRQFAHIVLSCRKPWGGNPVKIDYQHTNCSMFEAELIVERMVREQNLVLPVVLKKEICEQEIMVRARR